MILYSIIPPEQVFAEEPQRPEVREIAGGFVEGVRTREGFTVSRLCSTDPALYLKGSYSPGSVIKD